MKKTLIIVILLAAIASIAMIQALGINVFVPDATVHATSIQINSVKCMTNADAAPIQEYTGEDADPNMPTFVVPFYLDEDETGPDHIYDETSEINPNVYAVDYRVFADKDDVLFNDDVRFEYTPTDGVIINEEFGTITFLCANRGVRITIRSADRNNVSTTFYIYCSSHPAFN